jgi:outer membrane protein assembly factor BamA
MNNNLNQNKKSYTYRFSRDIVVSLFLILIMLSACSPTKNLKEGELLYSKTNIKLTNPQRINKDAKVKSDLMTMARPRTNSGIKLGIYNIFKNSKREDGLRNWVANKLGEPPIIYEPEVVERSRLRMSKYLKDNGYFGANVTLDTTIRKQKLEATYSVTSEGQYRLNTIQLPEDSTRLGEIIYENQKNTLLKPNRFYNQTNLKAERARLANLVNDHGYPDFNSEHLYYFIDTTVGNLKADVFLKIKAPTDSTEHQLYLLNDAFIFSNYDLNEVESLAFKDTILKKEGMYIIRNQKLFRPNVLDRAISQDSGDVYSKKFQDITVNHLLDLGVFRFVNLNYKRQKIGKKHVLDRFIYLTPDQFQSVTGELELNNRTGNFLGTAATVTYTHKNLFKGAERLNISLSGGVETQLGSGLSLINSSDLSLNAGISAPKFIVPFKIKKPSRFYVPRTELKTGFTFQQRIDFYTILSAQFQFGYNWRETRRVRHELYPIAINRVSITNRQPAFEELLVQDPRLARSFDNVFISGLKYIHVFTTQDPDTPNDFFFTRTEIKTSGNLFRLYSNEISGLPLSQFAKINTDLRYNFLYSKTKLVTRINIGVGYAYGISDVLPYSEQFFVGGANSLRAFRLRGLGPGRFVDDNSDNDAIANQFIDQTGDIKIELNAEYRFPMFSYLKGAIFVDAGNIWLAESEDRPEGVFSFDRFYREIAIGTGFGFRLDFEFFVIRLDIAFPIRKPVLNEGFQWTFDTIDFGQKDWRQDNLIWNIGIGYPF